MNQSHKKIIFIASVFIGLAIILCLILLWLHRIAQQSPLTTTPAPQTTSFKRDPYLDQFALKDAPPSDVALSLQEQKYPNGLPQKFPGTQTTQSGTLVVTSDMANVRIIITTKDPGDADLSNQTQYNAPANSAPLKIVLPANYYTIVAQKDQYVWKWIPIVIEPGKITRLQVHLDPADLQN